MSHELIKLTTIESDASDHVYPLKHGQGDGFHKPNETRPLPGTEMQQGGMRQVSHDTEVGRVTAVSIVCWTWDDQSGRWVHDGLVLLCVLHEGLMLDCQKTTGKNLIWSSAVDCSWWRPNLQNCRREREARWNSVRCYQQRSNEQRRQGCMLGLEALRQETCWTEKNRRCASEFSTGPVTLTRALSQMVSMVCCSASSGWTAFEGTAVRNRRSRVKNWVWLCRARATGGSNVVNIFSQRFRWRIRELNSNIVFHESIQWAFDRNNLAFVKVLGHSVMMLHSDQEPVLVQLLKTVQSRRFERTPVRHGPRTSHQSQSKIENVNQVITGVCWSMWLSLENILLEKMSNDSILLAWPIRHAAWSLTKFFRWSTTGEAHFCVFLARLARVSCHSEKEWCTNTLPCQQAIWIRDGTMESGLTRHQWQTNTSFWQKMEFRKQDRCTAWHPRRSSWSVSWRKLENFVWMTWQRIWSQRLRRTRTKVHLDVGVCVWRPRSWCGLEQHLDAAAVPDRDPTRKHVGCDREGHWLTRKKARVRERSEQNWIDCKNDSGAPTANSGDAPGAITITIFQSCCADARADTKHSERADGFTDGTGSTGAQRAKGSATEGDIVKWNVHGTGGEGRTSTIAPMMESFGLIVLLDSAPSSKDETTTGSLHAINGIDVAAALVPEEDVWQFEVMKTCAREIQFQVGEQESAAIVDREDPNVSKTINVCEARTGEKLNSEEMRKSKAKEVQVLDEFEVKVKIVKSEIRMTPGKEGWSKWVITRKDPNKASVRVVWSQPSRRQYSVEIRDQVYQEMWMVEWLLWTSSASELLATCSFGECKFRGSEGLAEQRYHFVLRGTTQGPPQETKDLEFAQESLRYSWHESSVCNARGGRFQRTRSSVRRIGAKVILERNVEDVRRLLERWPHSCHFRCQSKRSWAVGAWEVQG